MTRDDLMSIGEFATLTRMSVSALRFYADAGVLLPADVDTTSGYRRYAQEQLHDAQLLRELRVAGMPLAAAARVLSLDAQTAWREVDSWRGALGDSHATALRAIRHLRVLLNEGNSMTIEIQLPGTMWREAVRQVLPASARSDDRPLLGGVLVDARTDSLRLVATDSHRLAVRDVVGDEMRGDPERVVIAASDLAAQIQMRSEPGDAVRLSVASTGLSIDGGAQLPAVTGEYPDYEAILASVSSNAAILDRGAFLAAAARFALDDVVSLRLALDELKLGGLSVPAKYGGEPVETALQPRYLVDALAAVRGDDVLVDIIPNQPIRVRTADSGTFTTLIMPVRISA